MGAVIIKMRLTSSLGWSAEFQISDWSQEKPRTFQYCILVKSSACTSSLLDLMFLFLLYIPSKIKSGPIVRVKGGWGKGRFSRNKNTPESSSSHLPNLTPTQPFFPAPWPSLPCLPCPPIKIFPCHIPGKFLFILTSNKLKRVWGMICFCKVITRLWTFHAPGLGVPSFW